MSTKKLPLNSIVGIVVAILGIIGFIWTFYMDLRSMEVFVPRISLILISAGGLLVVVKDLLKPEKTLNLKVEGVLPYAIAVCAVLWLYGWSFRNIGLMTSTFFFLIIWWIFVSYRDAKRAGSFKSFVPKIVKLTALAIAVAISVNFLFITLLSMHLPRTPLP